jgi:putative FmdB family regulatory protein
MPLYEYQCGECSHRFELRRTFSEGGSAACPRCHGVANRVFAPVPIVFKGSGFYVTDYRKDKGVDSEKPVSKPPAKPEPKTECKAECKSECRTDKGGSCNSPSCKN